MTAAGGTARRGAGGAAALPTLETVAARAGVSRGTASRVLSGSGYASKRASAAVLQAAQELGYRPNRAARSLATRRSDSLALVVSETEDRVFGDPFFAGVVRGVNAELLGTDIQLVFSMVANDDDRARLASYAAAHHVDGLLLLSLHGDDPLPLELERVGVPVVLAGRPSRERGLHYVDADNRRGGALAAEHLLAAGRRRIATIAGPQDMSAGVDRLEGFYEGLRAAGRRPSKRLTALGGFTEDSGCAAMQALLRREPGVDAVFAASDLMAVGALAALRQAGRRVPDDVALVGFDDVPLARHVHPALTTVRQPLEEIGRQMARMLLARVRGEAARARRVVLPTELVVRESA